MYDQDQQHQAVFQNQSVRPQQRIVNGLTHELEHFENHLFLQVGSGLGLAWLGLKREMFAEAHQLEYRLEHQSLYQNGERVVHDVEHMSHVNWLNFWHGIEGRMENNLSGTVEAYTGDVATLKGYHGPYQPQTPSAKLAFDVGSLAGNTLGLFFGRMKGVERDVKILYRLVSHEELKQIINTKQFTQGPNSLEGKFFAESYADAQKWGDTMNGIGNHIVIEVYVPATTAKEMLHWPKLDGIGPARYGTLEQLENVKIYVPELANENVFEL